MKKLTFLVQGSQLDPYQVTFRKEGNNLTAHCTCRAGEVGQYCKHRFNLMAGDSTHLVSNNLDDITVLASLLSGSDVEQALRNVQIAEKQLELAKKECAGLKKALARALMN